MESEKDVQEDASKSKLQAKSRPKPRPSVQELYGHPSDPTTLRELYGSIGIPSDSDRTLLGRKLDVWVQDILLLWSVALFGIQNIRRFEFEGMNEEKGWIYFWDREYPDAEIKTYAIVRLLHDISTELGHQRMRAILESEIPANPAQQTTLEKVAAAPRDIEDDFALALDDENGAQ